MYLYFIQAGIGPIKIGWTTKPINRLRALQVAHYEPLKLLKLIKINSEQEETNIHNKFNHLNIRGEWFKPAAELLEYINCISNSLCEPFTIANEIKCNDCDNNAFDKIMTDSKLLFLCRRCKMIRDGRLELFRARGLARRGVEIKPARSCTHCKKITKALWKNKCHACSEYYRRHGLDRSLLPKPTIRNCKNCKKIVKWFDLERCKTCAKYFRKHKSDRNPLLKRNPKYSFPGMKPE